MGEFGEIKGPLVRNSHSFCKKMGGNVFSIGDLHVGQCIRILEKVDINEITKY